MTQREVTEEELVSYLSDPMELCPTGLVQLQQYVDLEAATFSIRVTNSGGQSFVAVGLNDDGTCAMVPANSIIGSADADGRNPFVYQYRMTADAGIRIAENPTLLSSTSVPTNDTSFTLSFTQRLSEI